MSDGSSRPTGTVSFLFTDIEGSTAAWDREPAAMPGVLARHDLLVRTSIERHGGYVFATGGDGFAVAFPGAASAIAAAVDAQRSLRAEPWPPHLPIRVRMAINTGEAVERDGDYFGPSVNRAARLMATANGGQVVVSERTAGLAGTVPSGVTIEARGRLRLKDLRRPESVLELVIDGVSGPPLRAIAPATGRLPEIRTSFIGRRRELGVLTELAAAHRLVTIVGPGGTGKTRLALEHAASLDHQSRDGSWFVDLSTASAGDVVGQILSAVGLPATGDWGPLRTWDAHIVLDNCEHVIDEVADAVDDLLAECTGVRLVATSREALAVPGEQTMPLDPMSLDRHGMGADALAAGAGGDAIRLFIDRARSVDPRFDPSESELDDIAQLCAALDGLPLAIELAAARIGSSSIGELSDDLLDPPTRRERRRSGRHRSLRATINWSVDLMDDATRAVFARLAVFEGGFTADSAAQVAAHGTVTERDVTEIVASLVAQSMVQATRTPTGTRLSLLETVRVAALELLGDDAEEVRCRHLVWAIDWSRAHAFDFGVPGWFSPTVEVANQSAALDHARASGDDRAAVELFSDAVGPMLAAGMFDALPPLLADLRGLPAATEPDFAARLDMAEMVIAELMGDFSTSHALAERFRVDDDDELRWLLGSALQIHHFAPTNPVEARRVLAEFDARAGGAPMSGYLNAEIAMAEADFASAADSILDALGADDLADVERRLRTHPELDPILFADLAVSLYLTRRVDDATAAVELLAERSSASAFGVYVPLLEALIGSGGPVDDVVAGLRAAASMERRWAPPLVVLDCIVLGSHILADRGLVGPAAEALGATRGTPQRSVSCFGVRRLLRQRLVAELGDDGWNEARERGAARSPRESFDLLVETVESAG